MTLKEQLTPIKNTLFSNLTETPVQSDEDLSATFPPGSSVEALLRQLLVNQTILLQRIDRYHAAVTGTKPEKPKKQLKNFPTAKAILEILASGQTMSNYEIYKAVLLRNPMAKEPQIAAALSGLTKKGEAVRVRYAIYRRKEPTNA